METVNVVKGFGRPFVFNSEVQKRVGRTSEAKESARVALKSPWWTLGCRYEEAAELAGWEDEQIEFIREKVSEEGKQDDLKKGKAPEQDLIDGVPLPKDVRGSPIVGSLLFESQGSGST